MPDTAKIEKAARLRFGGDIFALDEYDVFQGAGFLPLPANLDKSDGGIYVFQVSIVSI